jgi:DNA-binding transcriptional MerR regulator
VRIGEQGLVRPTRRPSGYRGYADSDVETVRRIRVLLNAGLGTATIAEVLPCMVGNGELLAPVCRELVTGLSAERDRIDAAIGELQAARAILDAIITAPVPPHAQALACQAG